MVFVVLRGDVADEFLDVVEGGFLFPEFVLDHLDVLIDLHHMAHQMVLEQFETDKGVANLTGDEALGTPGNDMARQVIHIDELVAGETLGLVVFIVHVLGQLGLEDKDFAYGTECEFFTYLVMVVHILAHAREPAFTVGVVEGAIGKDVFGDLDMGVLEPTACHGAFPTGGILVHPQVVHPEEFVLGGLVEVGDLGAEEAFFFHGAFVPVFVQVQIVF